METTAKRFTEHNGIIADTKTEDTASAYVDITAQSLNLYGITHGGLLFSLADSTAGMCAKYDDQLYVTLQANINYLEPTSEGRLTANAKVVRRGKTTCVVDVEIVSATGATAAKGTFTMYRVQ